jgi:ADP-dependent NAD(P)H-hydrate dehydratase
MSVELPSDQLPKLPPRPLDGHKGLFGRVLVVGGNEEMIGAPVLAGAAALRTGSGVVQIALPREVLPIAISIAPELIGCALGHRNSERHLLDAADAADALVIGPGMGRSREVERRVLALIRLEKAMVIDADALNALAGQRKWPPDFAARAVLTPHPGEMARLCHFFGREIVPKDDVGRIEIATDAARAFSQVVVLKGHRTIVADGHRHYLNTTGDCTLAKAGAGDILSGMIGSLLGQRMPPFEAAVAAVYLHGKAGELAGQKHGRRSALARDVISEIPAAVGEYERA